MESREKMNKKCECCDKDLEVAFGPTKYCNNCSLYVTKLNRQIGVFKHQLKKLKRKKNE